MIMDYVLWSYRLGIIATKLNCAEEEWMQTERMRRRLLRAEKAGTHTPTRVFLWEYSTVMFNPHEQGENLLEVSWQIRGAGQYHTAPLQVAPGLLVRLAVHVLQCRHREGDGLCPRRPYHLGIDDPNEFFDTKKTPSRVASTCTIGLPSTPLSCTFRSFNPKVPGYETLRTLVCHRSGKRR
eukprot:GFYU01029907.1.p1 GENE.GFYU01029907.1~~GFYU01029907.1.p1  ORF type:complete len:181 (+),score=0.39 GFYU01029907.1:359-901(+)